MGEIHDRRSGRCVELIYVTGEVGAGLREGGLAVPVTGRRGDSRGWEKYTMGGVTWLARWYDWIQSEGRARWLVRAPRLEYN